MIMYVMAAAAISNTSEEETLTLFSHMLKNWINFDYLEEHLSYKWLPMLFILLYANWLITFLILYVFALLLNIWKKNLPEDTSDKLWDVPRQRIAYFIDKLGWIMHGHEVIGMENLPEGPGIIIYYHGALITDYASLVAKMFLKKGRIIHSIVHRHLFRMPGTHLIAKVICCKKSNRDECMKILREGHLLGIAPGGNREGTFSDEYYNLLWGNHIGFAEVALGAKVPIIPMFTENLREGYRIIGKMWLTKWLYDKTGGLLLPIYGFPVKFRTYIGEPIPYDPNTTATELAQKTKAAIENLRDKHQKRPGNILRALLGRFEKSHKQN